MTHPFNYLALGDSYTIGEQVKASESFPYQTVALLRKNHAIEVAPPRIIATTGWTTDELANAIKEEHLETTFDIVSLLIGVNNQYRGRELDNYKQEFARLLNRAILLAKGRTSHVFVLSIPDWGVTPFAEGRNREEIQQQIKQYNIANKSIALAYKCHYLDITPGSQEHGTDPAYLTPDGLHYSGKEYQVWAEALATMMATKALK